jgi:lipoyl(octanoyl) transferase
VDSIETPSNTTQSCAPDRWRRDAAPVGYRVSEGAVDYPQAVATMESRAAAIAAGTAPELLWLLEHPPIYTAGTSADASDLLTPQRFPVFKTGRGGQYTYHGPGQRVGYVLLNLKTRAQPAPDIRCFVSALEEWLIRTLAAFGVNGERREGRVGIWVAGFGGREDKIGALGVRVRHWVTFHGVSLNVNPDLSHFSGIVPCGVRQHGVTSLHALGVKATMAEVDQVLAKEFSAVFGAELTREKL